MKNIITSFLLLVTTISIAQVANSVESIPNGYYNSATGTGYTLKTQLFNIINDHTDRGYGGLYTTYLTSDKDNYYENNGTLLDMYTENPLELSVSTNMVVVCKMMELLERLNVKDITENI